MSKIEKLINKFKSRPSDFKWSELEKLLHSLGFSQTQGSGSRVKFINENNLIISLHKPHPNKILKKYQIDQTLELLENNNLI